MSQAHPSMHEGREYAPFTEVVTQLCCGQLKMKKGGVSRERHALQMMPQQAPPVHWQQLLRKGLCAPPQRPNVMKREPHGNYFLAEREVSPPGTARNGNPQHGRQQPVHSMQ